MLPAATAEGSICIKPNMGRTMLDSEKRALVACAASKDICILPEMANRHGLITGATGTGKTVTLHAADGRVRHRRGPSCDAVNQQSVHT